MNSKNWCFTENNYENTEWIDNLECQYKVYGKEVGESGTPHLQGFIIMNKRSRLSAMKKINAQCHWEPAKGSAIQAADYCKKDGDYKEEGNLPMSKKEQGDAEQERWKNIRLAAEEGNYDEIPEKIRFKYIKTIEHIHEKQLRKRKLEDTEEQHEWYYGESGTGKSRKAREENPDAYLKMCNKWWDGYEDQEIVIIEDFDIKHDVLVHHMKIWADRYPFMAEIKGGAKKIRPRKIIVTSNYSIEDIWQSEKDLEPLLRRFKETQFKKLKKHS